MTAGKHDFDMDQGSFFSLGLTVSENGGVKNLSAYSARAKMRSVSDSSKTANFTIDTTNAATGTLVMELGHGASTDLPAGYYLYDLEIYLGDEGEESYVERIIEGRINLRAEVTN